MMSDDNAVLYEIALKQFRYMLFVTAG